MTRMPALGSSAALILIDLQRAIDHPDWGERNNPGAEQNIALLVAVWRASHRPIYHIRHDSTEPESHYLRQDSPDTSSRVKHSRSATSR